METEGGEDIHAPSAHWRDLHDLCVDALTEKTKDIELLSWLAEAAVRAKGLGALCDLLVVLNTLITDAADELHSRESDSDEERYSPIDGLSGSQSYEGTLIRPLRLVSLIEGGTYGQLCLYAHEKAGRTSDAETIGAFREGFAGLSQDDDFAQRERVSLAIAALTESDRILTEKHGVEAPNLSHLREMLEQIGKLLDELSVHGEAAPAEGQEDAAAEAPAESVDGATDAPVAARAPGVVTTREEAFKAMLEIAGFFRRTEPHSSIAMALETLVRRGRLDFLGLIAELVPDENQRRDLLIRAGIEPSSTSDNNDVSEG